MAATNFIFTGALDPEHHKHLYIERLEDVAIRRALARVGTECVLISLIGARQMGKTSLLNRLHAEYGASDIGWVAIKLDLMPLSDLDGEAWYRQFIALCCDRLQKAGVHITI